jgi:hypothetical protein
MDLPREHQAQPDTTEYNLLVEKCSLQGKDATGKRAWKKIKEQTPQCYAGMCRRSPESGEETKIDGQPHASH